MLVLKRSRVGLIAGLMVLSGCASQTTDLMSTLRETAPEVWSAGYPMAGETVRSQFWASWNDPILVSLIEKARTSHPDVLSSLATLRAARAGLREATASLLPKATIGMDGTHRRILGSSTDAWSATADGSWGLNLAGAEIHDREARYYEALAKEISVSDARELVAAETARAYINLRASQGQLDIAENMLKNYEQTAEVVLWRHRAGLAKTSELEDADSQVATAKSRVPQLKSAVAAYRNALARLTTRPVDQLMLGKGDIPRAPFGLTVSIPAQTLIQRPDVRAAQAMLLSAGSALNQAKADYFPSLSIKGSFGTQAATLGTLGASGTGIASLIGALSMPVLNWGTLQAREERAVAALEESKARYLSVVVRALEDTDNALNGIRSAWDRERLLVQALAHAEKSFELADLEYRSGMGDYARLLQVQQRLLTAREAVTTNRAELSLQHVALYRALGGAWMGAYEQTIELKDDDHE